MRSTLSRRTCILSRVAVTPETQGRVLSWAHAVQVQVDRLNRQREAALAQQERFISAAHYGLEDSQVFWQLEAERHYVLTAARQLLRALRNFDDDLRLPGTLTNKNVKLLRDALEHWDQPDGPANEAMKKLGKDPAAHQWKGDGSGGMLGDLVSDVELGEWARKVYEEVASIDPFCPS
jgi:hypothetical protein